MNEPIGRLGSLRPARARRTAFETVSIASCWPMTRLWSESSIWSSRSDSSWAIRVTGMPVHIATTWAISSSSTVGCSADTWLCHSARSVSTLPSRSPLPRAGGAADSYSWALIAASFSLVMRSSSLCASRSGGGADAWRSRTRLAASSMRSIALSGRWRSVM